MVGIRYGRGRLWKGMAGKNVVGVRYGRVGRKVYGWEGYGGEGMVG